MIYKLGYKIIYTRFGGVGMASKLKHFKKIAMLLMICSMTFVLSACDELPSELQAQIRTNMEMRADQNRNLAEQLHASGLISEDTMNSINESITTNLSNAFANIDEGSAANLIKATTAWRVVPEPNHACSHKNHENHTNCHGECLTGSGDPGLTSHVYIVSNQCESFRSGYISNYIGQIKPSLVSDNSPVFGGNSNIVNPIEVIPASLVEQINTELSVPIYALKGTVGSSSGEGLDEIMEAIRAASELEDTKAAEQLISQYFARVTYMDPDTGEIQDVTLLDPDDPTQQIVRTTSFSYSDGEDTAESITANGGTTLKTQYTKEYTSTMEAYFPSEGNNQPGIDYTLYGTSNEKICAVRLVEFNKKAIDELSQRVGLGENRYLVLNGKAFLMEYPLGIITGFKESEDRTSYDAVIERGGIGFNLKTGDFVKYQKDENGDYTNATVTMDKNDPYLTYLGAANSQDESRASLVMYGETGVTGQKASDGTEIDETINVPFDLYFGGRDDNKWKVSVGRIVLRDYLELTYAPDVVSGEEIIALGRKLRILQLSGSKNNIVAEFYDKDGNKLSDDGATLRIEDFADIEGLVAAEQKVKYISRQQEELGAGAAGTEEAGESGTGEAETGEAAQTRAASGETGETEDTEETEETGETGETGENGESTEEDDPYSNNTIRASATKIDTIPTEIVSEVHMTTSFPGEYVARSDVNLSDQKPLFYGMLVRKSMFETGLFSGWVQSTDSTKNSTVWWNTWLSQHGYNYSINTDNLVDFLKGNYATDLATENIIILDLETISKIQQEYTEEDQLNNSHFLRTIFIVFGYALIAYAIILLIAWNVDINVDLGFNILEKMTLGKWVAVKDYEELPYMNEGDTKFMRFGQLLVSCIFIIAVGILLIQVNIINIVLTLIRALGGLSGYLSGILTGVLGG